MENSQGVSTSQPLGEFKREKVCFYLSNCSILVLCYPYKLTSTSLITVPAPKPGFVSIEILSDVVEGTFSIYSVF